MLGPRPHELQLRNLTAEAGVHSPPTSRFPCILADRKGWMYSVFYLLEGLDVSCILSDRNGWMYPVFYLIGRVGCILYSTS